MSPCSPQGRRLVWFNGAVEMESEVRFPFRDSGAVRGEAAFDSARTFSGRIFKAEEHVARLFESLRYLGIDPPYAASEILEESIELARTNYELFPEDMWVTQRISAGVPELHGGNGRPNVMIETLPIPFAHRAHLYRDGMNLLVATHRRSSPTSVNPTAKTVNMLNFRMADRDVKRVNSHAWALLLDDEGNVTEGPGFNIFAVIDDRLVTPSRRRVLPGITRALVMNLARESGIAVEETDFSLHDLQLADEVFVTSTSLCVCPVASVQGRRFEHPIPGFRTKQLQDLFIDELQGFDFVSQYLHATTE